MDTIHRPLLHILEKRWGKVEYNKALAPQFVSCFVVNICKNGWTPKPPTTCWC